MLYLKFEKILERVKNSHFAKAIVTKNGEKWPITLGLNFKVPKTYEKRL